MPTASINNLLDNITSDNRKFVDQRLVDLKRQENKIERRLEEPDRLSFWQDEINGIVNDSMKFMASLEFVFREGIPWEKLVAFRQCIQKIIINKPTEKISICIYTIPMGNPQNSREYSIWI